MNEPLSLTFRRFNLRSHKFQYEVCLHGVTLIVLSSLPKRWGITLAGAKMSTFPLRAIQSEQQYHISFGELADSGFDNRFHVSLW